MSRLVVVGTELALVSERHRVGGTLDHLVLVDGELGLLDVKTSRGIYPEYVIQIAAYAALFEEVTGRRLVGGVHLGRFGRDGGHFSHHHWTLEALAPAWDAFLQLRALHEARPALERLTG